MYYRWLFWSWWKPLVSIYNTHAIICIKPIFYLDIEKTYNPPTAPKRQPIVTESLDDDATTLIKSVLSTNYYSNYFRRDLIVFKNFDLCQSSDLASGLVMVYAAVTPFLVQGKWGTIYAVLQAIFWRLFHSAGLGWLLYAQSKNKFFTRHFVKWGGGVNEAFQNWKR